MILAALCLFGLVAHAQQNLNWGQGPQVASPVVNADQTEVTSGATGASI